MQLPYPEHHRGRYLIEYEVEFACYWNGPIQSRLIELGSFLARLEPASLYNFFPIQQLTLAKLIFLFEDPLIESRKWTCSSQFRFLPADCVRLQFGLASSESDRG